MKNRRRELLQQKTCQKYTSCKNTKVGQYEVYVPHENIYSYDLPNSDIYPTYGPFRGAWKQIGYVLNASETNPVDKTMPLFARTRQYSSKKCDLRVIDSSSKVQLDVSTNVTFPEEGGTLSIPGRSSQYTIHIYEEYK